MTESLETSDLLMRLVDRSLVTYDEASGRYVLLETVRQYAAEHAVNSGESEALRDKHFGYFVMFADNARNHVRGSNQVEWLKRVDADYDNIRLALEWGVSTEDHLEVALFTAGRLIDYWMVRGMYSETGHWEQELTAKGTNWKPADKARLLLLGNVTRYFLGKADLAHTIEALRLARESGIPGLIGHALANVSLDCVAYGLHEDAQRYGAEGIALQTELGDWTSAAFTHIHLGNSCYARGDLDEAEIHFSECLRLRTNKRDLRGVGAALASLALVAEEKGDTEGAIRFSRQALGAFSTVGSNWDLAGAITGACVDLNQQGRHRDAAMMLGCSDGLLAQTKAVRDVADRKVFARWSERIRGTLGDEAYEEAYRIGRKMNAQGAIALAYPEGLEVPSFDEEEGF